MSFLIVAVGFCLPSLGEQAAGTQIAQKMNRGEKALEYLLYLPEKYEQSENWPLVLFLHGAGERGSDLKRVKKHGPPKLVAGGKQFPFILVSPQCGRNQWWDAQQLLGLVSEVEKKCKVDSSRIYVTGLSMGGFGTWALAAVEPSRFAAIAPVCGGGKPESAQAFASVPTWVFHGAKDKVVPLSASQRMVDAMKAAGGNPKLTIYPDAGHDSWTSTYRDPQFYRWLLEQKKDKKSPAETVVESP